MGWPAWVEDMRVVVVGDGRTEKKAYRINSEKDLSEHVDVLLKVQIRVSRPILSDHLSGC